MPKLAQQKEEPETSRSWAETAGAGDRDGAFLGLQGAMGNAVALLGSLLIMIASPAVVIYMYVRFNSQFCARVAQGALCDRVVLPVPPARVSP